MTKDEITKWFLCDERIMLTVAKTTSMTNKAIKTHQLTCTSSAVLGRALTMSSLMGAKLKNKTDNITGIITGDGPIGRVVTVAHFGGKVKGYVDVPEVDLMPNDKGKLDVGGAIGKGKLRVICDYSLTKPYVSEVELVSGEIAEDYASYYANSLQQPCAIGLGVLVDANCKCLSSGGFLVEVMPDATEKDIEEVEYVTKKLSDISKILKDSDTVSFVNSYFGHMMPRIYETIEPAFHCDCSMARVKKVISSLPAKDRESLYDENGEIEVLCDFCNKKRRVKREDFN